MIWMEENQKQTYEGYFYVNQIHGYGCMTYANGMIFEVTKHSISKSSRILLVLNVICEYLLLGYHQLDIFGTIYLQILKLVFKIFINLAFKVYCVFNIFYFYCNVFFLFFDVVIITYYLV